MTENKVTFDRNTNSAAGQVGSVSQLDTLFATLREEEPVLHDSNFTKMVINSVDPKIMRRSLKQSARSGISFDLFGLAFGVMCAYLFVELPTVLEFVLNVIPSSITISPFMLVATLTAVVMLSVGAWWVVEEGSTAY